MSEIDKETKVTIERLESDQPKVEQLSKEDIQKMIEEITEDSLEPEGALHVPKAWFKPNMHFYYMKVDIAREDDLVQKLKYKQSKNDKGECYYLEGGRLILMEQPIEIHEHIQKLKNAMKKKRTEAIIEKGSSIKEPGVFVTKDTKSSKDYFD